MMKRKVFIAAALAMTATLAGCGRGYQNTGVSDGYRVDFPGAAAYAYVNIWRDPVTGCESYITDDGFMSPRMNADGSQRCIAPRA